MNKFFTDIEGIVFIREPFTFLCRNRDLFVPLADVDGYGNNPVIMIVLPQEWNTDRGVEPATVCNTTVPLPIELLSDIMTDRFERDLLPFHRVDRMRCGFCCLERRDVGDRIINRGPHNLVMVLP